MLIQFLPIAVWNKTLRHRHDWSDWSEWVEERDCLNERFWSKHRTCRGCGLNKRREVGRHVCLPGPGRPCPHRPLFGALLDDPIDRLERELGLKEDI